jgi:polar amino acid transport system substrate-binding protein
MRHRSLLFLPLLVVGALVLGACGDDSADETTTTAAESGGGDEAAISIEGVTLVNDGQLTVCSDMPYEPFEFQNDAGETEGFDYDVVSAMGDKMGLEVEFVTTPFDGIIPALVAGNCDMIASAMTITEERAEQVNFTEPYFDADQSLLVTAENEETFATLDDLAGKTIGVQSGTTGATYAMENLPEGATIKEFAGGAEMFPALVSPDGIDAALQDLPVNAYRATQSEDLVVTETFATGEQYGFAVTKESTALLTALNEALAAAKEDGSYDAAYTTWFGEPGA